VSLDWPLIFLVAARIVPICVLGPLIGGQAAPGMVRLGGAAVLVGVIAPHLTAAPANLPLAVAAELLLGAALAFAAAVPLWAARAAGTLADSLRGVAPPDARSPLGEWLELLAVALFFLLGGHLVLVGNLAQTYAALPPGLAPLDPARLLPLVLEAGARVFEAALALAAPLVLAQLFVELGAAMAGRLSGVSLAGATAGVRALGAIAALLISLAAISLALRGELARALVLALP